MPRSSPPQAAATPPAASGPPGQRQPTRRQPSRRLARSGIVALLAAGAVLVQAIQPVAAAHAQTPPPASASLHLPPSMASVPQVLRPGAKTKATPKSLPRKPDLQALRAKIIRQAQEAQGREKTGSFRVSPAALAFLSTGLGMHLGASRMFTGLRSGEKLRISLPAPGGLELRLPAGTAVPSFSRAVMVINEASGTATLTAAGPHAALAVTITHAASTSLARGQDLNSHVTLRVPLPHGPHSAARTVGLNGRLSYVSGAATISLSGPMPAGLSATAGPTLSTQTKALITAGTAAPGPSATPSPSATRSPSAMPSPSVTPKAGATPPASASPAAASGTTARKGRFTMSRAVHTFIASTLKIPVGPSPTISGTLSGQTLTVTVGAPGQLPLNLPAGVPSPSFGATTITLDESAKTMTLDASATAGVTANLHVTIAHASTSTLTGADVTAVLTLGDVPFVGGSTVTLTGTLGYSGGVWSGSLAGTLASDAPLGHGVALKQGAALTLATKGGISISSAVLAIGSGSSELDLAIQGSLTDLKNWNLSLSGTSVSPWTPATGLSIAPAFAGTITDTAGTVRFDLSTAENPALSWAASSGATLNVGKVEVSNQAPPSDVTCPATVKDGDVWVGTYGTFSYAPAGLTGLTATGCIDLTGRSFTIGTSATGNLTSEFNNPLFSVTGAALTATGDLSKGTFSVTGTAQVNIVSSIPGVTQTQFSAGLSFGTDGIVAGVSVPDLGSLGLSGTGGTLYVATSAVKGFDPSTLGFTGAPFNLPAGLTVSLTAAVPQTTYDDLGRLGVHLPASVENASVQTVASLSASGFALDFSLSLGDGANGLQIINHNGTAFYLDSIHLTLAAGSQSQVSIAGAGFLEMPAMAPGTSASSTPLTVSVSANLNDASVNLGFVLGASQITSGLWMNALGISGLGLGDFGVQLGLSDAAIPTLKISADNVVLPSSWGSVLGVVQGAQISFNVNVDPDTPVLTMSITGAGGAPALQPLAIDPNAASSVVNSLDIYSASLYLAPAGGVTAAGATLSAGVSVAFAATVDNVPVNVQATVDLSALTVKATASVASYPIAGAQMSDTTFNLNLSPSSLSFGFSGGISYQGDSFTAEVDLAFGTSANGAFIRLSGAAGYPSWLALGGSLTGEVSGDGSGASISAWGTGSFSAGGRDFGTVSFYLSIPGGLQWSDYSDSITQIASWFLNAGTSVSQVEQILQNLGFSLYDILNALGSNGAFGGPALSNLETFFGAFSSTYYDIWTYTSSAEPLVLDVSGGSQSPNAGVITWDWDNGYNQDWAFVQSPSSGWYNIVNRGSGQCLTVNGNSTAAGATLVQYPCNNGQNQLWYMGGVSLNTTYVITSASSGLVMDVQGAYPWRGGTMDQWSYNGGWNQQFWLTNSGN